MGRIFLSHSSSDNAAASALRDWLEREGWSDVFLDFDPDRGISAGQRWSRALSEAANRCEAVIFLLTKSWLASEWCQRELDFAIRLNKQIFGVIYDDISRRDLPTKLTDTWQVINLATSNDHELFQSSVPGSTKDETVTFSRAGLTSLKVGLRKAGLDTRFFVWPPAQDPERRPWRGLAAMEADDAGIFFGREAPTIEVLDQLRGMLEVSSSNIMVILGASGAGKSSFLRAGLWPRLTRDDSHFLPLPVMRPERAAISGQNGFVSALDRALANRGVAVARASVTQAIDDGAGALMPLLNTLAKQVGIGQKPPAIVISIDQAEELFLSSGRSESTKLLKLLADLVQHGAAGQPVSSNWPGQKTVQMPRVLLLMTIRSDAYEPLQTAPSLEGLPQKVFNLTPMPAGAWSEIIEGPVRRMQEADRRLSIEPALVARLLTDLPGSGGRDTLPLLSFALERLYVDYGGDGNLTEAEYEQFGGIGGAIQAAISGALKSADNDQRIPSDFPSRMKLLRMAFIPWLAGFDPGNDKPRRNVARWNDLPESSRPLVEHLVDARLLSTDIGENGVRTVEPTHEALLRQWNDLKEWLQADAAALTVLTVVQQASRDWILNDKRSDWLTHRTGRLEDAERLYIRPDLAAKLSQLDVEYVAACRAAEDNSRNRELEEALKLAEAQKLLAEANALKIQQQKSVVRRTRLGLAVASVLAILAASLALWGFDQTRVANDKAFEADRSQKATLAANARLAANLAEKLATTGQTNEASLLLLQAVRHIDPKSVTEEMSIAFQHVLRAAFLVRTYDIPKGIKGIAGPDSMFLIDASTKNILRFDGKRDPQVILHGKASDATIDTIGFVDGVGLIVLRTDDSIERISLPSGARDGLGKLMSLKQIAGRTYDDGDDEAHGKEVKIHSNGVLVVSNQYQQGQDSYGATVRVFDTRSHASLLYDAENYLEYLMDTDGTGYLRLRGDDKDSVVKIAPVNGKIVAGKPTLVEEIRLKNLLASTCLIDGRAAPAKDEIKKIVASDPLVPGGELLCAASKSGLIYSFLTPTSAGTDRADTLTIQDQDDQSLRSLFWPNNDEPSSEIFSWVGLSPSGKFAGAVLNRSLVMTQVDGSGSNNEKRFSGEPGPVMFLSDDEIAALDPENGKIEVHRLDASEQLPILAAPNEPDAKASKVTLIPMNTSSCLDEFTTDANKNLFDNTRDSPGGSRQVAFVKPEEGSSSFIEVTAKGQIPPTKKISLGDAGCTTISSDGRRVVRTLSDRVEIADFEKVIAGVPWSNATIATFKQKANSAYFVGSSGQVITTDGTYSVYKWTCSDTSRECKSTVIYKGNNIVVNAEPNEDGSQLIVKESIGEGNIHGFLYSTLAQKQSWDLGTDYKYLGAAFTSDGYVAISTHASFTNLIRIPTFEMLKSATAERLAASCQPKNQSDYSTSPCWPNDF